MAVATMTRSSAGDLLRYRCEDLVAAEMRRLARRVPGLPPADLRHVAAALGRVVDELVLSRARAVPGDRLVALFGLADVS